MKTTKRIVSLVTSFARDLTKYVKAGMPKVTPKSYFNRLTACKQCPHFNDKLEKCKLCGCYMPLKAKWKTTTCPDNPPRWQAEVFLKKEVEEIRNHKDKKVINKKSDEKN